MSGHGIFLTHHAFSSVLITAACSLAKNLTKATQKKIKLIWLMGLKGNKSVRGGRHDSFHSFHRKLREEKGSTPLSFSVYFRLKPQPMGEYPLHSGSFFPLPLSLSGSTLKTFPEVCFHATVN